METAYRTVAWIAHRLPAPTGRLGASQAGRRRADARWVGWSERHRPDGRLVWLHAASVGEVLAAEPIVRRLRAAVSGLHVVLTHTSSSVTAWDSTAIAEQTDYLPRDEPRVMARVLDALRPDLLLLSRGDLWPALTRAAHARRVPVTIAGAVVRPRSLRLRWPARAVLRPAARSIAYVGAVTDGDAERWCRLGVLADRIAVTGDPRHDHVIERTGQPETIAPLLTWARDIVIVAGSVEREDEAHVLGAAAGLAANHALQWLVVPHDPTDATCRRLLAGAAARELSAACWSGAGAPPTDATLVVVRTRGVLFDLYALGTVAYVGGGFRRGQLHAVAEPAAAGVPVLVGPQWQEHRDAATLISCGGGAAISRGAALGDGLSAWLMDPESRRRAGGAARAAIAGGATDRTVEGLLPLLARGSGRFVGDPA
jgi:3-deoxy-D-manno-octulosonic-acid transferase